MKASRSPANKIVLSAAQEKAIRERYLTMPVAKLAAELGLKTHTLRMKAGEMGIRYCEMEYWTDEQVEFLEFVYPFLGDSEIAAYLQQHSPKKKPWTKKHIEKKRRYLNIKRTKVQLNAIRKRNIMRGDFAECPVKAWEKRGACPVGTVKVWKQHGETAYVKTKNGYVMRNPWLWEQHYGPVPKGMVVYCPDDAPVVCDISDLSLKTRAEILEITRYKDSSILKRQLKVADPEMQQEYIENHPEVIELARATLKLNGALRAAKKKSNGK